MNVETALAALFRNTRERSETYSGNVPSNRMFRVAGYTLVPVLYATEVSAENTNDACLQFADFVSENVHTGRRAWERRSRTIITNIYDCAERSKPNALIVPERFSRID